MKIKIVPKSGAWNFYERMPLRITNNGGTRRETWRDRLADRVAAAWRRLTWFRQTKLVVERVDTGEGIIGVRSLHWSWRRWAWV